MIFSALHSSRGASHFILKLIIDEKIKIALTPQVFLEYNDVLTRKKNLKMLSLSIKEIEDILDLLVLLAEKHSVYFLLRPNLIDENDNMIVECAFTSNSRYLITSNVKDFRFPELKGFGFKVVTPAEFFKLWEVKNE